MIIIAENLNLNKFEHFELFFGDSMKTKISLNGNSELKYHKKCTFGALKI